ncbi:MAG: tetraacyldisaccharide 4'-kinase [Alphaproteobacteria bacterium]|nr:tetraacyldisaccharide 4'-kinase [Alphaproteobacteria bacterium]MCL2757718.1 tetraacyldisaccharide 4'-kinase [Alphaproteobacteria bacterium]
MKTPSWFQKRNAAALALLPAAVIYGAVSKLYYNYRLFWQKTSKIPVICVGGVFVGGTGKTPIVREIASKLPGSVVITRGYKGGDEAKMLEAAGIPVIIGGNRQKSIKEAEKAGFKHAVMDDGFQNPTIKKDISILVFDGKIGVGNGFLLPAGPLRESLCHGIRKADAVIIINGENRKIKSVAARYKKPVFLAKSRSVNPGFFGRAFAFAGIGYPEKFFDSIKAIGIKPIDTIGFPDHYQYTAGDVEEIVKGAWNMGADHIITTEKDWVRLAPEYQEMIDFIPLETTIEKGFWTWLLSKKK